MPSLLGTHVHSADLADAVSRLRRAMRRAARAADPGSGLSVAQLEMLSCMAENPGSRPGQLARLLRLAPSSVATLSNSLRQAGLVTRTGGEGDRRTASLDLTPAGEAAVLRWKSLNERLLSVALRELPPDSRVTLLDALPALADLAGAVDALADDPRPRARWPVRHPWPSGPPGALAAGLACLRFHGTAGGPGAGRCGHRPAKARRFSCPRRFRPGSQRGAALAVSAARECGDARGVPGAGPGRPGINRHAIPVPHQHRPAGRHWNSARLPGIAERHSGRYSHFLADRPPCHSRPPGRAADGVLFPHVGRSARAAGARYPARLPALRPAVAGGDVAGGNSCPGCWSWGRSSRVLRRDAHENRLPGGGDHVPRHLIGVAFAVALAAAIFFGGGWGVAHMTGLAAQDISLTSIGGLSALGILLLVGLFLGILMVAPVSPLSTALPGVVMLAWTGLLGLNAPARGAGSSRCAARGTVRDSAPCSSAACWSCSGTLMICTVFVPSRWRRERRRCRQRRRGGRDARAAPPRRACSPSPAPADRAARPRGPGGSA